MAETPHIWKGEQGFRSAAQLVPGPLWTARPDGKLDWVNDALCALTGQTVATHVQLGFPAMLHAVEQPAFIETWHICLAKASRLNATARIRTADGGYRWHLIQCAPAHAAEGTIESWIGTATDVHAQVTAVETLAHDNEELEQDIFTQLHELNRSRSRLQTIFDACPDYLFLVRLAKDGSLTYEDINVAAASLYEGDRASVVGRTTSEVVGVETAASLDAHVRQTLRSGTITYEVQRRAGPHATMTLQVVGAPIAYSNEEEGLVLFCGRDITEQRAAEEALRQSQKMEAVGQLTGGLAHDFNNLLTGIMGSLDLLQVRVAKGRLDRVDVYVNAARDAAERAAALTHRLLAFSRRQTLDPKPTDANGLITGLQDLLQRTAGPEVSLAFTPAAGLWTVLVDVSQLENALLNLCINARDAMPNGGRIIVETKNLRLDERSDVSELAPGDYVTLSVSDNGTGMSPEVAARIFDPFFTTKPMGSGTGLGLSMIYGFARQSGGHVRVHTSLGSGTTLRILLPRHFGIAEGDAARAALSAAPRANGETILIVDDEVAVRSLASEVLEDLGYEITVAAEGLEGMKLLQSSARYDVLITDVGLPGGLNGRQVAEAARLLRPAIKILFITGYAENAVFNHGHLAPGMQVLTKPFGMEALASRVRRLIEQP